MGDTVGPDSPAHDRRVDLGLLWRRIVPLPAGRSLPVARSAPPPQRSRAKLALGVARAAIDAFIEIPNRREITVAALGGQRVLLRTSPHTQVAISRAEGLVRSARSHVFEVLGEVWATLIRCDSLSSKLRASYHVANTNAHRSSRPSLQNQRRFIRLCARPIAASSTFTPSASILGLHFLSMKKPGESCSASNPLTKSLGH